MHWIKNFSLLKKNLLRLLHISGILKTCLSSSFIMLSPLAQLSAAVSPDISGSGCKNFLLAQY